MKIKNIAFLLFPCSVFGWMGMLPFESVVADENANSAAAIGLTLAWETNIGGSPLANGENSFVVWPHSTTKREYVTVRLGDKILQQIDGNQIDDEAIELALSKGEVSKDIPRIGLAGATKRAEKLVARYKAIGKQALIEDPPFSQQLTYIVTLSDKGILSTIDSESGAVLWSVDVGDSRFPFYGPGVSDDTVVVTNGNFLYLYSLADGTFINKRKLQFSATGVPTAMPGKAIVPSIGGRLIGYDIKKVSEAPFVLRNGDENRLAVRTSVNRQFISWPMKNKIIMAEIEKDARLWTSVSLGEHVSALPAAVDSGFVACGINGTVVHFSTDRVDSMRWKRRLAVQVTKSPVVSKDKVFIVSDEGILFGLHTKDGRNLWESPVRNIRDVVSIGKSHLYATNESNLLVSIDLETGTQIKVSSVLAPRVISNSVTDRLFFIDGNGELSCLREIEATRPTYAGAFAATTEDSSSKKKQAISDVPADDEASETAPTEDSLFEGAGDSSGSMDEDVFGSEPM